MRVLVIVTLLIGGFSLTAFAAKSISFYYSATSASHVMVDGLYIGDKGKTALEQQNDCIEYVKSLFPYDTKFLHLSCTPQ